MNGKVTYFLKVIHRRKKHIFVIMTAFEPLALPAYNPRLRKVEDQNEIFDPVRKKWIVLTPEEWVRQHVINTLIAYQDVPAGLIAIEKGFKFNTRTYRADIVIYNTNRKPVLIIECKAPDVKISQAVFEQIFRYNLVLKVPFLWVTDGNTNYVAEIDYLSKSSKFLDALPVFKIMDTY